MFIPTYLDDFLNLQLNDEQYEKLSTAVNDFRTTKHVKHFYLLGMALFLQLSEIGITGKMQFFWKLNRIFT